jgi:hypothetical protein
MVYRRRVPCSARNCKTLVLIWPTAMRHGAKDDDCQTCKHLQAKLYVVSGLDAWDWATAWT